MTVSATKAARSYKLRWLVGPWTRWVRDPADLIRISFGAGFVVLLVQGDFSNAIRLFLTFAVSLVPRLIATPLAFDLAFGAAMSLQAWGNVSRLFNTWAFYHNIVHFLLTMATASLFYFVFVFLRLVPNIARENAIHQRAGIAVLVFAIGSTVGAIYEEYEWFAINVLHGNLVENYTHDIHDLFFNALGSIVAGAALIAWSARGWPTRHDRAGDPFGAARTSLERWMDRSARDPAGPLTRAQRRGRRVSVPGSLGRSGGVARILLGDWTRTIRDVSDLMRLSLAVGLIVFAAQGNWHGSARFGLSLLAALGARWINSPRAFDAAVNAALMFQAWGSVAGAFGTVPGYEAWTHFVVSLAFGPLLYLLLIRARVFPEFADEPGIHRRIGVVLAAMCLGYCAGIYYELYVWLANHALSAHIGVSWDRLTKRLGLDWLGSFAGGVALLAWDTFGWGTRRRVDVTVAR